MSKKPISEPEQSAAIEFLERCGWTNAELIWEQIQEAAAQAWLGGDQGQALELWRGALEVAEEHLAADDPRRVTSRVNASEHWSVDQAGQAIEAWRDCGTWVSNLTPSVLARSSTFHLRLRTKHPGAYDRPGHEQLQALHREGLEPLRGDSSNAGFSQRIERWHAQKPDGFNDYRKLLAAVLFIRHP